MEEIPVYLFTGFMDSGKTSLIKQTLIEDGFASEGKSLLIVCEDGDEEYDEAEMAKINTKILYVEKEEDFTDELLKNINLQYLPDQVFIEFNGTWGAETFVDRKLPEGWILVQSLCTIDASTFEMYMQNMRAMMLDQFFDADVVIFNRCTLDTARAKFRANIKQTNRRAQIVYELTDGSIDEREEELPFDINADVIELSDADYALWFMDCQDNPKKYDKKKIHFLALVYNPDKLGKGLMVPGRFAMTCCVEDVQFIGFKCKYAKENEIPHKSWIDITAEVHVEFAKEYRGKGPVLYPIDIKPASKPEDELVYFS
ncbi:MAG: GTPase [Lachnospiraceae bacterium]|nr:GTPase [Lachnospiraceae bacterium]